MKENIKDLWITALRSGKYKQSRGFLKTKDGFCCLGVLCDVYAKTQKKKGFQPSTTNPFVFQITGIGGNTYGFKRILTKIPPDHVYNWAGMSPYVKTLYNVTVDNLLHRITSLPELNDSKKYTFDQIAEVIEKHWQQL
jgi:hypothetical protein